MYSDNNKIHSQPREVKPNVLVFLLRIMLVRPLINFVFSLSATC